MTAPIAAPRLKVLRRGDGATGMLAPGVGVHFKLDVIQKSAAVAGR